MTSNELAKALAEKVALWGLGVLEKRYQRLQLRPVLFPFLRAKWLLKRIYLLKNLVFVITH